MIRIMRKLVKSESYGFFNDLVASHEKNGYQKISKVLINDKGFREVLMQKEIDISNPNYNPVKPYKDSQCVNF